MVFPHLLIRMLERSDKPSKAQKEAQGKSGFVVVKARWVIERSNAGMEHCKSSDEKLLAHFRVFNNKTQSLFCGLMIKRLATSYRSQMGSIGSGGYRRAV
ncbi:MAG: transposase [Acaryochloris sp. RU_4_1]|nr:transposase [Acaryochloris sp. RU_4_1]NJR53869.1 transposase [Acaryochloris sp. CRU_2_0]